MNTRKEYGCTCSFNGPAPGDGEASYWGMFGFAFLSYSELGSRLWWPIRMRVLGIYHKKYPSVWVGDVSFCSYKITSTLASHLKGYFRRDMCIVPRHPFNLFHP